MNLWKKGVAFICLNPRTFDWKVPLWVMSVVRYSCPSLIQIWLYPDFMSNLEKMVEPWTWSMI